MKVQLLVNQAVSKAKARSGPFLSRLLDKKGQDAVTFGQCYLKLAIEANLQAKACWDFAFAGRSVYFSSGGCLRCWSLQRGQERVLGLMVAGQQEATMGTVDKQGVVTMEELLVSSLATADALAKLLINKGLITEAEFTKQLSTDRAVYQAMFKKVK